MMIEIQENVWLFYYYYHFDLHQNDQLKNDNMLDQLYYLIVFHQLNMVVNVH